MPALQTLLSRGQREFSPADDLTTLCALFGVAGGKEDELPVAALYALGAGLEAQSGWWLCADPVHLLADRDQLILSAHRELALTQAEADALVAELNHLYAGDGWQFIALSPQRWLLRLPEPLAMRTTPTELALGCRLGEVLPRGADAMGWQRVMTEAQMLLHTSPVNARRAEEGRLAVNGLWFWGGGGLPATGRGGGGWTRVIGDDALLRGLARLNGLEAEAASAPAPLSDGGRTLRVESMLSPAVKEGGLEPLEQQCFAPLLAQLQEGSLSELVLVLPGVGRWTINRAALRRWWRWRKPLDLLLKGIS
jgi:hypothetical protein